MKLGLPLAGALLAAGPGLAAPADMAGIVAQHGRVYETPKAGLSTQGFLELDNPAASPDLLTGAECPIAGATRIIGPNGAPVRELPIAAGQHLALSASGPHLLLQATHFSIDRDGAIPCSLTFRNAGEILVYLYAVPAP